jgi:NAD(P)-dependent dehydrogenase (short-subunit alcohol dehydrogenase family)
MSPRPDFGENTYKGHGKLDGKVALITGADSGIGRAIAVAFAREGADIAIAYWNEHDDAKETQQWVEKAGRKSILIDGNLAQEATCKKLIDNTLKEFGRIDILVNNASMQEDLQESFIDIPRSRLENTYNVNILAMFTLAQLAAKQMLQQKSGNIINVGSIQAYQPTPGILDYASTKGAITTMTKGIATELASKGIRCNVIAPGPVWTPLVVSSFPSDMTSQFGAGGGMEVPMKRPGQPADYQGPAVFLASDDSAYVTGSIQNVTGGMIIG